MRARILSVFAALLACGGPRSALAGSDRPATAGPYSLEVVDESGAALPTFSHRGRTYVLGALGQRYLLRVRNGSGRRVEVVASVDGRDVVDGRPATWGKRGYVVEARGELTLDGYRLGMESVAAFRFSSVPRSYASRMGDAREVGVIGAAVFPERVVGVGPPLAKPGYPPADVGDRAERQRAAPGRSAEAEVAPAPPNASGRAFRGERRSERPGLGTEFGEERDSRAYAVRFERARPRPDVVLTLRYDDREGLLAAGVDVDHRGHLAAGEAWLRETAEPFRRSSFAEPPPGWGAECTPPLRPARR